MGHDGQDFRRSAQERPQADRRLQRQETGEEDRQEGREEGREEGRLRGRAETVLMLLDSRGIEYAEADRERIMSCTNLDVLAHWAVSAASVKRIEELFEV